MWSPLLGVQKPCQLDQGKRFQEGPAPGPPAAAAEHAGASLVRSRSGLASWADQPVGESAAGWRQDQDVDVPPLWEVKVQGVPPLWEVKELQHQDAHLTRPRVGVEGAANHVAPPLPQH